VLVSTPARAYVGSRYGLVCRLTSNCRGGARRAGPSSELKNYAEQSSLPNLGWTVAFGRTFARHSGCSAGRLHQVIVPLRQAGSAKLVEDIEVFGFASITQLLAFLRRVPDAAGRPQSR
jgi:hypothetical protein